MTIKECTRNIPCVDCDDNSCAFHGRKEANCPKWRCENRVDCETECEFIDKYIEKLRKGGDKK